mmetsp:Transcript_23647/g.35940  ORF Transcript_23647/g.35940 Transcript_23647/m.35940 type:complete len:258 (-) Transcript_23647:62-835(-)
MGRSQVARNQRGRGRGKTRGRGDTTSTHTGIDRGNLNAHTSSTSSNRSNDISKGKDNRPPHSNSLGDNSFRYQDNKDEGQGQGQGRSTDEYDWDINNAFHFSPVIDYSAEIESLSFAQISIHDNVKDNDNGNGEEKDGEHSHEINLARLSACIDSAHAPTSEWMRLSPGMTKVFDERFADTTMETERMTITEMARSSRNHDHEVQIQVQVPLPVALSVDKQSEEIEVPDHQDEENSDSDLDSDSDDNDEEWLDSIID